MPEDLGKFLENLRGKMSLREASKKSGLSHSYIRDLELGINRKTHAPIKPSVETLKRLSETYDYSYNDLLKRAGYMEGNESDSPITESDLEKLLDQNELSWGNRKLTKEEAKQAKRLIKALILNDDE